MSYAPPLPVIPYKTFLLERQVFVGGKPVSLAVRFKMPLLTHQLNVLKPLETNMMGEILVENLRVSKGIELRCKGGLVRFLPEYLPDFLGEFGLSKSIVLEGIQAVKWIQLYKQWEAAQNTSLYTEWLRSGKITFGDIKEHHPALLEQPAIKNELVKLYRRSALPKHRRGKRAKIDLCAWELYSIARCKYYNSKPMSWNQACGLAIDENPHLVPATWVQDSLASLKKEARKLSKHYGFSQKNHMSITDNKK